MPNHDMLTGANGTWVQRHENNIVAFFIQATLELLRKKDIR